MAQLSKSTRFYSDIIPMNVDDSILTTPRKNLLSQFTDTEIDAGNNRMKVYLRIRPLTKAEIDRQENQRCLEVESAQTVLAHAPKESHSYRNTAHGLGKTTNKFTFSHIFKEDTSQKEFFKDTMLSSVKDFIDGQNCLVFSYGVTSSGKTYTIQGNPSDAGVLPRALDVLFNSINGRQWGHINLKPNMFTDVIRLTKDEELQEKKIKEKILRLSHEDDVDVMSLLGEDAADLSQMTNTTTSSESSNASSFHHETKLSVASEDIFLDLKNRVREETAVSVEGQGQIRFSVWVSFAEIYNEQIFDLLEAIPKSKKARRTVLKLSDDKNGCPYVKGLKQVHVESADEAYKLLVIGQRNLRTACTKLNHHSSRSHCIFNIKVLRVVDKGEPHVAQVSMLSFCDLAGSERSSKTQTNEERLREACSINTSLMTLGRCIEILRFNQTHKDNKIIPFRESKLTRLFQNFFNGTGRAAMIINVSQCASLFDETINVLKFSAIATKIIVTQKAEPPPKFQISSLSGSGDTRPSISWATPYTLAKSQVDMESAVNMPLPEDDDEDLNGTDDDDAANTLLQLIEDLKQELIQEKRSKILLEAKIREEVCQEMMKQLVEIENNYSERIRFTEQRAEDIADRRIQIYLDAVSSDSQRKKADHLEDDDDEYVSSILLHQEQARVEALETKTKDLEAEIAELKRQLTAQEQSTMKVHSIQLEQQQNDHSTNHHEEIDELKKQLAEAESTIHQIQSQIHQAVNTKDNDMEQSFMAEKLEEAREKINSQQAEIMELNEMLTEAGETFENKETEISRLKELCQDYEDKLKIQAQTIKALETAAEKSRNAMESADLTLTKREKCLVKLQDEMQQLKGTLSVQSAVIPDTPPLSEEPFQSQPQSHHAKSVHLAQDSLDMGNIDSDALPPDTTGYASDSDDEIVFKTRFIKDPKDVSVLNRNQGNKASTSKKSFTVYHDFQGDYIIPSIEKSSEISQTPKTTQHSVSTGNGSYAKKRFEECRIEIKCPKERVKQYLIKKPLDNSRVLQVVLTPINNKHVTQHTKTSLLRLKNSPRHDPTCGRERISRCPLPKTPENKNDRVLSLGKRKALEDLNTSKRRRIESVAIKKAPIRKSLGKKYNLRSRR